MSKLKIPVSWAESNLSSVCEIGDGNHSGKYPKSSEMLPTGVPFIRAGNLVDGTVSDDDMKFISPKKHTELKKGHLKAGDILFSNRGEIGKVGIVPPKYDGANLNSQLAWLRFHANVLLNKFGLYFLGSPLVQEYTSQRKQGSALQQFTIKQLNELPIVVPPLGEQKRIVAMIESTQEKIKTIESSISKAEELIEKYRESLLQKAFRGELVPQDPNDEPASKLIERIRAEKAKQSDGKKKKKDELPPIKPEEIPFEIPKSWEWVRLGELENLGVLLNVQDGNHGEIHPKASDYVKDGIHFIMANNIGDGFLDLASCKRLPKRLTDKLRIGFSISGDVLLSHKGTIGATAIVPEVEHYVMLTPQVTLYRVDGKCLLNTYLLLYFQSKGFQYALKSISKQATRDYVGITRQKEFLIPLPPFEEQVRIANNIQHLIKKAKGQKMIIEEVSQITRLLSESILSSAFSGQLVPQDPTEGTGYELLEKIRSEQSTKSESKTEKKTSAPAKKKRDKK